MWTKQARCRLEEPSAPLKRPCKRRSDPDHAVATADAAAPPPDAAVAKEVDQKLIDAGPPPKKQANPADEGARTCEGQGTEATH